jgi:hypothetical protein
VAGYLIVLIVLAIVFTLITGPLRAARHARSDRGFTVDDLRAARDAKYQEIRDAEMDMRTGKLSEDDYAEIDRTLRAEAIEILHRLDEAEAADAEADARDAAEEAPSDPSEREQSLPSAP